MTFLIWYLSKLSRLRSIYGYSSLILSLMDFSFLVMDLLTECNIQWQTSWFVTRAVLGQWLLNRRESVSWRASSLLASRWFVNPQCSSACHLWNGCRAGGWRLHPSFCGAHVNKANSYMNKSTDILSSILKTSGSNLADPHSILSFTCHPFNFEV